MDTREQLIQKAKEVADKLGTRCLSRAEFFRESDVSKHRLYKNFHGMRELCELAGLEAYRQNISIEDEQVFSAMRDAVLELGKIASKAEV